MTYCLKCKKIYRVLIQVLKTKNGRKMLSKCAACGSKTWRFMKEQEAKGLLSSLGLKTPLGILLGDILF